MRATVAALAIAGALGAPVAPAPLARQPAASQEPAEAGLNRLLDEDYEAQARADPVSASLRGDRRFDDRLPDNSPAARTARLADDRARLAALAAIDPSALSEEGALNAALLRRELTQRIDAHRFHHWQTPITQMWGPQRWLPDLVNQLPIDTDAQRAAYLDRLQQIAPYIDHAIDGMREGLAAGNTPPRLAVTGAAEQALAHGMRAIERSPRDHAMFAPFAARNDEPAARAERLIAEQVAPAFERLGVFLRDEYAPACRDTIAATDRPDGQAWYDAQVALHTTLDLNADQVHELGLREVDRIRREMFDVIARSGFAERTTLEGDALFAAFTEHLRTEPRFYFDNPEDLLDAYRAIGKRIDAQLPRLFATLPRLPWGVREMPPFIARSSPTAYYYPGSADNGVAGYFVANTLHLDQRPRYEMIALTLHEAVPGHHLQYALQDELELRGTHRWRTTVAYTAFTEGWALYAERLGLEMEATPDNPWGLYKDPFDDFGRLSYEMWRAMRLVVDTGVHARGWSRERAVDFMLHHSALTRENVEREVDRYIAWPAQALGYKVGELRIRSLREFAERELGDRFDIRAFHDAALGAGSIPLDQLEARVRAWVRERSLR